MTLPVPNQKSPLAQVKNGFAYLIPPWNSFFQQLIQTAPAVISVTTSPFQANSSGTVIVDGAATTTLTRGTTIIALGAGQKIIPIGVGDIISWTGPATVQFLGA